MFSADSYCPGFPDDAEGTYGGYSYDYELTVGEIEVDAGYDIPGNMVDNGCIETTVRIRLWGTLYGYYTSDELIIDPTEITFTGGFQSYGSTSDSCPCEPDCSSAGCEEADGCGGICGWCDDEPAMCTGYTGSDPCCNVDDTCGYAENGNCDCDDTCSWDSVDCEGGSWTCNYDYYDASDGCDCGCGIMDPDCEGPSSSWCDYCNDSGACSTTCADIDPDQNWLCI